MLVGVSQDACFQRYQDPPVQCVAYMGFASFFEILGLGIGMSFISLLAQFEWSRRMLLKHTDRLTFGSFSHQGPTAQQIMETSFTTTIFMHAKSSENNNDETVQCRVVVRGPEMAYATTPICAVNCALTMSRQKQNIPAGVLTSATAFHRTNLIEMLQADGLHMGLQ